MGVAPTDSVAEAQACARKIRYLRLFADQAGHMNRDVSQVGGGVLVVSQFTLMASTRKGRRPSFDGAARGDQAEPLVALVVSELENLGVATATGRFGADMQVALVNDGPVTVIIDT